MIIKSNQTVLKNYLGETKINKIYAGENLVFGQEEPKDYMYFQCVDENGSSISMIQTVHGNPANLLYSSDSKNWQQWTYTSQPYDDYNTSYTFNTINLNNGDIIYFKGDNPIGLGLQESTTTNPQFILTGNIECHGNIMSLLYDDNFEKYNSLPVHAFYKLFKNNTSLLTAPKLPATELNNDCYGYMFLGCTSLTEAPELPAITLHSREYFYMFDGCSRLNYIKAMFTSEPGLAYTQNWVKGISSTGTFIKNSAATWNVTGVNGIPEGWTVQTIEA